MYDDVDKYVKSCEECQRRARLRYEEPLHPTWSITVWEKVGVDVDDDEISFRVACSYTAMATIAIYV